MKRQIAIGFFLFILLLSGCAKEQTFEEFFHQKIKEIHVGEKNYSYSLIDTKLNVVSEDDAIAVFKEQNERGEQIFIAYFKKQDNQWEWKHTRGSEWDTPVKWSAMHQPPYIYSGPISDNSITEVFVGKEPGIIMEVENDKRFWYAISPIQDNEVFYIREDGTREKIEEVEHEKNINN
ncbi:hypothetical protein BN1058_02595 [Paraliobacillus sp. PM-2]|uniref:hypothetical protein n=1 Tax=Paraliobacillus sp. PM-2 TaxID=1462524 RepID=UPI00061BC179|nr:hypothetical protein [Paraliobacillus sp. PM-2]CQR48241.1 hypothetical protein BN1058_02595 [Paraliobacillus sp. PM-2]